MKSMKKMFQRGISLLEVMLSLSIIAVILVMAVRYYATANLSNSLNATTQTLENVMAAGQAYKNGNSTGDYTGVTVVTLCNTGLIPAQNLIGGTPSACSTVTGIVSPASASGGVVTVAAGTPTTTMVVTDTLLKGCTQIAGSFPNGVCTVPSNGTNTLTITVGS